MAKKVRTKLTFDISPELDWSHLLPSQPDHWLLSVMRTPDSAPAFLQQKGARMLRRRFKHTRPLKDRLLEQAQNLRDEVKLLPPGPVRDAALKKARQIEAAAHMNEWLNSPRLRPPTKGHTRGPN